MLITRHVSLAHSITPREWAVTAVVTAITTAITSTIATVTTTVTTVHGWHGRRRWQRNRSVPCRKVALQRPCSWQVVSSQVAKGGDARPLTPLTPLSC